MNAPFVIDRPDVVHRAVNAVLAGTFPTIGEDALLSSARINHTTAWIRQVGMYLMSGRLGLTQSQTAHLVRRDRSTISHACQLCEQEADARPATAAFFDFLTAQVMAQLDRYADEETQRGTI